MDFEIWFGIFGFWFDLANLDPGTVVVWTGQVAPGQDSSSSGTGRPGQVFFFFFIWFICELLAYLFANSNLFCRINCNLTIYLFQFKFEYFINIFIYFNNWIDWIEFFGNDSIIVFIAVFILTYRRTGNRTTIRHRQPYRDLSRTCWSEFQFVFGIWICAVRFGLLIGFGFWRFGFWLLVIYCCWIVFDDLFIYCWYFRRIWISVDLWRRTVPGTGPGTGNRTGRTCQLVNLNLRIKFICISILLVFELSNLFYRPARRQVSLSGTRQARRQVRSGLRYFFDRIVVTSSGPSTIRTTVPAASDNQPTTIPGIHPGSSYWLYCLPAVFADHTNLI